MENEKTFPCSHCRRLLPASEFYINHRTQQRDRYCKSCRQEINRRNRKRIDELPPVERERQRELSRIRNRRYRERKKAMRRDR